MVLSEVVIAVEKLNGGAVGGVYPLLNINGSSIDMMLCIVYERHRKRC